MEFCQNSNILRVFLILKIAVTIALIVLPIIVIILTIMDISKGIIGGKPSDELKQSLPKFIKRIISALAVIFIPSIMSFVFTELTPVDSSVNQCFTNANLEKIEELAAKEEEERQAALQAEKEENERLKQEAYEKELEKNKKIAELREKIKKEQEAVNGTTGNYSGDTSGLTNVNMTAKTFTGSKTVNYWELIPSGVTSNPGLIIFLHGTGECGNMNSMLSYAMPKYMNEGYMEQYNAIFIAPNSSTCNWSMDATAVKELINSVVVEHDVDPSKIIITGHSLGGKGTWHMISKYPGFFSAAVPMSGCAFENINSYVGIPIRNYVGASEETYVNCTYPVVRNINNAGGTAEYYALESPYDTHSTVIEIYKDPELINWMLSQ